MLKCIEWYPAALPEWVRLHMLSKLRDLVLADKITLWGDADFVGGKMINFRYVVTPVVE